MTIVQPQDGTNQVFQFESGELAVKLAPCQFPRDLLLNSDPAMHLLLRAFPKVSWRKIVSVMGSKPNLLSISTTAGDPVFALLCADDEEVRSMWSSWLPETCRPMMGDSSTIVVDFIATAPDYLGQGPNLMRIALSYLQTRRVSRVVSECQELRQLVFWLRKGAVPLVTMKYDPYELWRILRRISIVNHNRSLPPAFPPGFQIRARTPGSRRVDVFLSSMVFLSYEIIGTVVDGTARGLETA